MKFAVIFGVTQMVFGIIIKGLNNIHFSDWITFFFEFVPQILFMVSLFGYMIVTIFLKWATDWTGKEAPSLISNIISMSLNFGEIHDQPPLWNDRAQQEKLQQRLIQIAIITIPWMLLPKPLIKIWKLKHANEDHEQQHQYSEVENISPKFSENINLNFEFEEHHIPKPKKKAHPQNEEENMPSEIFVHQLIETIEFVLGGIANTASYLRLWALSLAHS